MFKLTLITTSIDYYSILKIVENKSFQRIVQFKSIDFNTVKVDIVRFQYKCNKSNKMLIYVRKSYEILGSL